MPTNVNLGYETAVREHQGSIDADSQARREAAATQTEPKPDAKPKESK